MKLTLTVTLLFFCSFLFAQVNFTTSNLPIILVDTDNRSGIPDEPKVGAEMRIINNGVGQMNHIDDEPNDYVGRIGIELRGQTSASFPKKPYGFETQDETGANNNVSLLGMPKENDWVFHNPYSDKSLIRNAITYSLAGKIMDYAPRVRMVELVINEEYRGVYLLTEKVKRDKNRVDISKLTPESEDISGGYILKFDKGNSNEVGFVSKYPPIPGRQAQTRFLWHYPKFDEITNEQAGYIQNFMEEFEEVLASENFADSLEGYRKYIDVQTFIDFLFINELTKNVDGYRISTYMYKDSDEEDGRLKMGPVWDFNLALGNADYCEGGNTIGWGFNFNNFCPQDFWVIHFWWKRLFSDPAFKKQAKERWQAYREKELSDENIFGTIDSLTNLMTQSSAVDRNFKRWPGVLGQYVWPNNFVGQTYQSEVAYLRDWTERRLDWLDRQFANLGGTPSSGNNAVADAIKIYPNPTKATQSAIFEYTLNSKLNTSIDIYNSIGQFVTKLVINESSKLGEYQFVWDYLPPAGVYYYNVISREGVEFSGKVIVID